MTTPRLRPPRLARLLLRLRRLGDRREDVEADLLELFHTRAVERGRWHAALAYFGDVVSLWSYRRPASEPSQPPQRGFIGFRNDITFALRLFKRQPGLFGVTVAGLAVAIGMSTAVFSIVNAVAFRGFGIAAPESVYRVALATGTNPDVPWVRTDFVRIQPAITSISATAIGWYQGSVMATDLKEAGEPTRISINWTTAVSGNYFTVLGGRPALGRTLSLDDDVPGAAPVLVLSHAFWTHHFGADPSVVGQQVRMGWAGGGFPVTIVGVAAREFTGPIGRSNSTPAGWMTFTAQDESLRTQQAASAQARLTRLAALKAKRALEPAEREALTTLEAGMTRSGMTPNFYVSVLGRLAPGASPAQAAANVGALVAAVAAERGTIDPALRQTVRLESLDERRSNAVAGVSVPMLMTAMGVVVALACANLTNLLLASAAGRRREIGTRLALGAGRGRIVRQLLTESVMLGLLGGAAGLLVATWMAPALASLANLPPLLDVSPDLRVYGFVATMAMAVGVLAGLAPVRYSRRGDLLSALKSNQLAAPNPLPRSRLRSSLVGGQAAGSVVLLVLAALLTRSLVKIVTADVGFDAEHLMTFQGLGRGYDVARSSAFWDLALERVRGVDGVAGAALTMGTPFGTFGALRFRNDRHGLWEQVSADYFDAVGIKVLRGRSFSRDEISTGAKVALISARLAREFWGGGEPIGSSLDRLFSAERRPPPSLGAMTNPMDARIVGVVADTTTGFLSFADLPTVYLPIGKLDQNLVNATMVVRSRIDPHALAGAVTGALNAIDSELAHAPRFVSDSRERQLSYPKMLAVLAAIVGMTAVSLAVVGLFGVTAFVVGQRRHEVSVRVALGASRGGILRMLVRDSLRPVVIGLACGVVAAAIGGQFIRVRLYGITAHDPIAIAAAITVLLIAAMLAVLAPARRAATADPAQVLRQS